MADRGALTNLGIRVYGLGGITLGLVGLAWGDFAAVWQPVPESVPHRTALAYVVAACFLAGGLAMQWRRTALYGAVTLVVLYLPFAGLWLRRVIGFPNMIGTWSGFAEQFALVLSGVIAYALLVPGNPLWTVRAVRIAYIFFGMCFATLGLAHFLALAFTASMVPAWIPPGQRFWAIATGVAHVLAGISILSGVLAALASRLLTAMIIVFGALVWAPSLYAQPHVHMVWAGNAINLALIGAAWVVADSCRRPT
jgi:uncharacterized membrane protein YphA (DoxX/SURF4 family)